MAWEAVTKITSAAIAALIDGLSSMREGQAQSRREIFEEELVPLAKKMDDVHSAYRDMFLAIAKMAKSSMEKEGTFSKAEAVRIVESSRECSHHMRNRVRWTTPPLLALLRQAEESRFLKAVALYFVEEQERFVADNPRELDGWKMSNVVSYLETPSGELLRHVNMPYEAPETVIQYCTEALRRLDHRFFLVSTSFTELSIAIRSMHGGRSK